MPRPQSVQDGELFDRLAEVFRVAGYAGASLGELADAARLRRASLYHRFPDGKAQMAEAVLERVRERYAWALEPMSAGSDPAADIAESARRLGEIYHGGRSPCVLDTLTLSGAPDGVRAKARTVADFWIDAMAGAAERAGHPPERARTLAVEAFVRIEGGLVYSRVQGDLSAFERGLAELPATLTGDQPA